MERRTQGAQRPVELRRQHEHEEGLAERDPRVEQPQAHLDRDHRRPEGRERLERQRGNEGEPQHLQGDRAVTLVRVLERAGLVVHAGERPQGGEAGERVEKARGESRECRPLPPRALLGGAPDEPHEERDERERQQEHEGGEGVAPQHRGQHQGGDDGRERGLRQVLPDVGVEGLHPAHERVRELAGPLARGEPRPEREEAAHEAVAHRPPHLGREPLRERLLPTQERRARGEATTATRRTGAIDAIEACPRKTASTARLSSAAWATTAIPASVPQATEGARPLVSDLAPDGRSRVSNSTR